MTPAKGTLYTAMGIRIYSLEVIKRAESLLVLVFKARLFTQLLNREGT